jgi:hypothetical protein
MCALKVGMSINPEDQDAVEAEMERVIDRIAKLHQADVSYVHSFDYIVRCEPENASLFSRRWVADRLREEFEAFRKSLRNAALPDSDALDKISGREFEVSLWQLCSQMPVLFCMPSTVGYTRRTPAVAHPAYSG